MRGGPRTRSRSTSRCSPTSERILGAEHPDTLTTRHNLAIAYQRAGRVDDAIAIYEPLLADRERILGTEHPDTLDTRNNLAAAYRRRGRVDEAIAIYEPLLADRERILGTEHPDTLTTRNNLAIAYDRRGARGRRATAAGRRLSRAGLGARGGARRSVSRTPSDTSPRPWPWPRSPQPRNTRCPVRPAR